MFCRFCGKELEENAAFCGNCGAPVGNKTAEKSEKVAEPFFAEEKPLPAVNPRMEGFGKALTGTILSFVGMVLFFVVCALIVGAEEYNYYYDYTYVREEDLIAALFLLLGAIALGVVSVVFGVKSIKTFKNAQGQKPIATLILGIISLAEGAGCLLACAIIFFPLAVLLG